MIQRVYQQAKQVPDFSEVYVATDDVRIFEHVQAFGGQAVMTLDIHQSGTDRPPSEFNSQTARCGWHLPTGSVRRPRVGQRCKRELFVRCEPRHCDEEWPRMVHSCSVQLDVLRGGLRAGPPTDSALRQRCVPIGQSPTGGPYSCRRQFVLRREDVTADMRK